MEAAAAKRSEAAERASVAIVWTEHEARVDAGTLEAGQYIAADIMLLGAPLGTEQMRVRERVTSEFADLGRVYRGDNWSRPVGRVVRISGSLIHYELEEPAVEAIAAAAVQLDPDPLRAALPAR